MWESIQELDAGLKTCSDLPQLTNLYSLSVIWRSAVYSGDYKATDEWNSILALTDYGKTTLEQLRPSLSGLAQEDILLAYFAKFFHHDLFFDSVKTQSTIIREVLQREILQERISLPHRFGRLLYDRFNDNYGGTRTDHLMSPEVEKLLRGTPAGVYQLGTLVSGPLGVIDSQETRFMPPDLNLPLWHCSDTGCNYLHNVALVRPSIPAIDAWSRIKNTLRDRLGPPSEWIQVLNWQLRGHRIRRFIDLPAVIGDCIIGRERTALVEGALVGRGDALRNILALSPRRKRDVEGSASEVASRLGPEAQLQLLLALPDLDLVCLIDDAVLSKTVRIPVGEIRELRYRPPQGSKDSGSQPLSIWNPICTD